MTKKYIISEIIRTAEENNGNPLGRKAFEKETGIKESDWTGIHWARWSDAVKEAGYEPNVMTGAYDERFIVEKAIALIKELGKFPTQPEFRLKRRKDQSFPSHNVFLRRLGRKHEIARKVLEFCETQEGLSDVADICRPICKKSDTVVEDYTDEDDVKFGFVYLIKSGRSYKIGRSISAEKRHYEIDLKLPEKATLVHKIKTDDPVGIEAYWHKRFQDKRTRGEWFSLEPSDIKAFKRRKFM